MGSVPQSGLACWDWERESICFTPLKKHQEQRGLLADENEEMAEIFSVFLVSVPVEIFRRKINKDKSV